MSELSQFAPDNRDADGRRSAAEFIKHAHTTGTRRDLIKDHFTAGNVLSVDDRPGNTLKKAAGVHQALQKLAALGVRVRGGGNPVTHAGSQRTVKAMKKALQHRHALTADFMTKANLPPEDAEEPDGELASTGAVNDWSTQGQTASAVRADLLVGREHTAEQHSMGRGRPVSAEGAATASGSGARERKVRTTPTPTPDVSAAGRGKDPNRDDPTLEAIKAVHAGGPRPMWG